MIYMYCMHLHQPTVGGLTAYCMYFAFNCGNKCNENTSVSVLDCKTGNFPEKLVSAFKQATMRKSFGWVRRQPKAYSMTHSWQCKLMKCPPGRANMSNIRLMFATQATEKTARESFPPHSSVPPLPLAYKGHCLPAFFPCCHKQSHCHNQLGRYLFLRTSLQFSISNGMHTHSYTQLYFRK